MELVEPTGSVSRAERLEGAQLGWGYYHGSYKGGPLPVARFGSFDCTYTGEIAPVAPIYKVI